MTNNGNEYAVITQSRTHVSFCGIGRGGRFSGSEPLLDAAGARRTKQDAMVAVLKVLEDHGVTDYEIIKGK